MNGPYYGKSWIITKEILFEEVRIFYTLFFSFSPSFLTAPVFLDAKHQGI